MNRNSSVSPPTGRMFSRLGPILQHRAFPLITLVLGLCATYVAWEAERIELRNEIEIDFKRRVNEATKIIDHRMDLYEQVLRGVQGYLAGSRSVSREEFGRYVGSLKLEEHYLGIQGVGFARIIHPAELVRHEQEIRKEGYPEYAVRPGGERAVYTSIIYLEPFSGRNLRAFGYDMFSEPVRRAAMELARDSNRAVLSGKVTLVQETDKDRQAGTLMYVPVYEKGLSVSTVEERRRAIRGWAYSPYRMNDLMRGILGGWEAGEGRRIRLEISNDTSFRPEVLLYDSRPGQQIDLVSGAILGERPSIVLNDHLWSLRFTQPDDFAANRDHAKMWYVLIGGTSMSGLLFALHFLLVTTRRRGHALAETLTRDLRESEEKYRIIFNNEIYAISIFDLQTLVLLDVNDAYCRIYGYDRDELLSGMTIHDITAEHQSSETATTRAARDGTIFIPLRYHKKKDGSEFPVEIVGGPYSWMGRKVMFALAHDITGRRRVEETLQESEQNFRTLANSGRTLVWSSGTDKRCTYFNRVWLEFTGRTLEQEMGDGWAEGVHPEDLQRCIDTYVAAFDRREQFCMDYRLRRHDGEYRWIQDDGFPRYSSKNEFVGYIGQCYDITERRRGEEALQKISTQLNSVLESARDVIAMMDTEYRYILFNSAFHAEFEKIFGRDLKVGDSMPQALAHLPDDLANAMEYWDRVLGGEDFTITQKFGDTQLERNWYEFRFSPIREGSGKVIAGVHIVRNVTERKLAEERIQQLLGEKELLLQEVHHRIKNNMNTMMSLLSLQAKSMGDAGSLAVLNDARRRMQSMMVLYDKLYRSEGFRELSMQEYLPPLVHEILDNLPNRAIVTIETDVDDFCP